MTYFAGNTCWHGLGAPLPLGTTRTLAAFAKRIKYPLNGGRRRADE